MTMTTIFLKESAILRKVFIIFNEDDLSSKIYLLKFNLFSASIASVV